MKTKGDLIQLYANCWRENWAGKALSDYVTKETLIYGDFARRVALTQLFFKAMGVKPDDKIALLGKNNISWVVTYMAALTYGAVVVPILSDFNPTDAQHIINHSDSVLLFVDEHIFENLDFEQMPKIRAALSLEHSVVLDDKDPGKTEKLLKSLGERFQKQYPYGYSAKDINFKSYPADHLAVINYTSGTTGFSKGVMLTLDNLLGNVEFGIEQKLHRPGSRCLSFLPLAHAYGCAFDMLTPLAIGTHVTLLGKLPSPKILVKAFSEVKPHLILSVPLVLEKIYRKQILPKISKPSVRRLLAVPFLRGRVYAKIRKTLVDAMGGEFEEVIVGGAPLNREVEDFLIKIKFPLTVGYGMTECGPLISYTHWRKFIPGSAGRTLPNMFSKVNSDNEAYIPGEICVKGQNVMVGYYKNPKATAEAIDKDGWLHTGDMGTISDAGTIFIRGRYKTMILSANGQNIYPEEIEAKLNNMPYVAESLVVERGNKLVALVYPDYEAMDASRLTIDMMPQVMEKVKEELNRLVAPYERIDSIQLRADEFEKTPKKSIKRYLYNN